MPSTLPRKGSWPRCTPLSPRGTSSPAPCSTPGSGTAAGPCGPTRPPCSREPSPTARPGLDPAILAAETAAFLEGAHLLWLLDPEQVDLTALHRRYFEGLAARLKP
ncbi:hypothetical protein AB0929_36620 [Streptomyces massasporeus]|uniref:hypothetical protein n=1 Tax=Streptomyces massasporeus TaxID=67324 RepID=UPI003456A833